MPPKNCSRILIGCSNPSNELPDIDWLDLVAVGEVIGLLGFVWLGMRY
jgi:hypothetical protein